MHYGEESNEQQAEAREGRTPSLPNARVRAFSAEVTLTPRLSVGTAAPESIYESRVVGKIEVLHPNAESGDCEIALPLDVLGIAPIDRLGELTWLGPISVVAFGLLVGLVVQALSATRFDVWMLLLTVGTFAGAYPLMYFAQEYISLGPAVVVSAGIAIAIIGVRAVTLLGVWRGLAGIVLPATAIMSITLIAAIWKSLQGVMLTSEALGFFIAAMMLMPKVIAAATSFWAFGRNPGGPRGTMQTAGGSGTSN